MNGLADPGAAVTFDPHTLFAIGAVALAVVVALLAICIDPGFRRGRRDRR